MKCHPEKNDLKAGTDIMNKGTLNILTDVISDIGSWQRWNIKNLMIIFSMRFYDRFMKYNN